MWSKRDINTEFRVVWAEGSIHHIRAVSLVQRDASGNPVHMIGSNWDITASKLANENDTTLPAAHSAREARLQAESEAKVRSSRLKPTGTLAVGLAHDFNNILATVVGYAELTDDDLADESEAKKSHRPNARLRGRTAGRCRGGECFPNQQ